MTNTITRPHQVTAQTVEAGDILRLGYGTLTITDHEVAEVVKRWIANQTYTNAIVRFTDGTEMTLWAGDRYENRVYYMQRDGVNA